mmetsp:Transcript_45286/g.40588  ORF Transcript_45286/g.40588 Transcript_45286/m.40588 type:complete len:80 (+) Transcript_45286:373-612(+)
MIKHWPIALLQYPDAHWKLSEQNSEHPVVTVGSLSQVSLEIVPQSELANGDKQNESDPINGSSSDDGVKQTPFPDPAAS